MILFFAVGFLRYFGSKHQHSLGALIDVAAYIPFTTAWAYRTAVCRLFLCHIISTYIVITSCSVEAQKLSAALQLLLQIAEIRKNQNQLKANIKTGTARARRSYVGYYSL